MSTYCFYIIGIFCLVAVAAHKGSGGHDDHPNDSGDKHCGTCGEIKRHSCRDYYGKKSCTRPRITEMTDKKGCKSAIIRCRGLTTQVLASRGGYRDFHDSGESFLFNGQGSEKLVQCRKNHWYARDIYGEWTRFKKVYCLEDAPYYPPQESQYPPQYPPGNVPNYPPVQYPAPSYP